MARLLLSAALLLAALPAFAQTGSIVGTVTDTDGAALPGANVRIDNTTLGTASGADGTFRIPSVPTGSQTVIVTLLGYARAERDVTVTAVGEVRLDVALSTDVLRLSGVAVTASRREEDLTQVPRSVAIVPAETVQLYTEQSPDLSATLGKFVPNFTAPNVGNSVFTATLRGRAPLYLLDGVPLATNEGVRGAILGNLDPSTIERVEVLYGASSIYGGGAPGGVIQFFTKEPSQAPLSAEATLFARNYLVDGALLEGEALDYRAALTVSGTQDRFSYLVNGAIETNNGIFEPDGDRLAPGAGRGDFSDYAVFAKAGYALTPSQSVQLTFSNSFLRPNRFDFQATVREEEVEADPESATAISEPVPEPFTYDESPSQRYTMVNAEYAHSALGGGALRFQGFYYDLNFLQEGGDIRSFVEDGTFPESWPGLFQTSSSGQEIGARAEYVRPFGEQVLLTIGGDVQREENATPVVVSTDDGTFDQNRVFDGGGGTRDQGAPTEILSGGAFAQLDADALPNLRFSYGARFDYIDYDVLPFVPTFTRNEPGLERLGGSGSDSGFSFNLGAAYEVVPQTTLFVGLSQGFSLPQLAFLFTNVEPGVVIRGDDVVSPQIVTSVEGGIRGQLGDRFAYGLAGFYAFSEEGAQIVFVDSTGFGERIQAPQRNYGFELTAEAAPVEGLRVGGDLSWTETDVDPQDDGTFQPSRNIESIPLKTTFRASYAPPVLPGLSFRAELLGLSDRDRAFDFLVDNDGDGEIDVDDEGNPSRADQYAINGYITLDLGVGYEVPAEVLGGARGRVSVQVLNVLNELYIPPIEQRNVGAVFASRRVAGPGRTLTLTLGLEL